MFRPSTAASGRRDSCASGRPAVPTDSGRVSLSPTQPLPVDPSAPLAEALHSRYVLERELGRGGMATVYLARDLRHHRPVAIKVYIALFQNMEVWNDYKRTCLPALTPATGASQIPVRLVYPLSERTANPSIPGSGPARNWNDPNPC